VLALAGPFVDVSATLGNVESFRGLGEVVKGALRSLVPVIGIKAGCQLFCVAVTRGAWLKSWWVAARRVIGNSKRSEG
jgi:hypothetical protein